MRTLGSGHDLRKGLKSLSLQKRFYKSVELREVHGDTSLHYELTVDGRPINTPQKKIFRIDKKNIAYLVAQEWASQGDIIDPSTMPLTKLLNSAIDVVQDHRNTILDEILNYASSDLICYRAQSPDSLISLQREIWEPILNSVENELRHPFLRTNGILYIEQPTATLNELRKIFSFSTDPALSALHLLTTLTGSALLAFLLYKKKISVDRAWAAAHLDEDWQNKHWGIDPEANMRRLAHERDYKAAFVLLSNEF